MIQQKSHFQKRLAHFKANSKAITTLQSKVKMWITRKKFIERKQYLEENVIDKNIYHF
jgi:hypothetical protein